MIRTQHSASGMQSQLPPLVYELSHAGAHAFAAGFGISLDNHPFDMALPKLFKDALNFIKNVAMKQQPYWILRINSPGGAVDASLKPILDLLFAPTCPPFFTVCEGIAASCGFVLYCAGWSSPNGLGASVSPRAQLMCHRWEASKRSVNILIVLVECKCVCQASSGMGRIWRS